MPTRSSSVQQAKQALGGRLREIRTEAGLTARRLGHLAGWHPSKVSKIEHGTTNPTVQDLRTWCEHCNAPEQISELIASLRAVEGMFIEWRRLERTGLRLAQESVAPLWERTRNFRIYSSFVVPGPVQTGPYITAVLSGIMVRRNLPDDVNEATAVRELRQRVIYEGDHRFAIVLEESVLRSRIGGAETMSGQLGHLLAVSSLPSVSLGIIPATADRSTTWPIESFWMFDDEQVAVELVSGYLTITQPTEVAMYGGVFAEQAAVAVYGAQARALIIAAIAALDA
ncbi:helix-turn-helix transcriptional regulator [Dactylosporangium sp. NPDC049525]|uniref:helix-turn-helix domain-containing protein n=1 Tax=Dactylosporangium sp. NPDC049525 TaxID=3154730 RepID=UPI00341DC4CE